MKKIEKINTLFIPFSLKTKSPVREEIELWTIQRQVIRKKSFDYLSDEEYLKLGNSRLQHVGLLSLCSVLRNCGYQVNYFIPDEDQINDLFLEEVADCDMLLVSSFTYNFNQAIEYSKKVRELNHRVCIGIGGHHAPHLPEMSLRTEQGNLFTFTIKGYAENVIKKVPLAFENGNLRMLKDIPQLAYIDPEGGFHQNTIYDFPLLKNIPLPANDLIPVHDLIGARVFSAYGCPFMCKMCNLGQENSYSERPLELFEQEIDYLIHEKEVRYVYLGDPTLAANLERFKQIVDILNSYPLIKWGGQTRLPIAQNAEFRAILANSECVHLEVGIESLAQPLLNHIQKDINATSSEEILYRLKENKKVYIETNWMFGMPGSNETTIRHDQEKMKQYIRDGMDTHVGMFVPFPGTPIFAHPEDFGIRIEDTNWDNFTFHGKPVFGQINGLNSEEIFGLYRQTMSELKLVFEETYDQNILNTRVKDLTTEISYF